MMELLLLVCVAGITVLAMSLERRRAAAEAKLQALSADNASLVSGLSHHESLASVGQATAELAHELRSPLTCAVLASQLLDQVTDERRVQVQANLRRSLARMEALIRQVDGMTTAHQEERAGARDALDAALQLLSTEDRMRVSVRLPASLPAIGLSSLRLSQLMHNLIDNGLAHGKAVWVAGRADDGLVELSVHDDGPGVPEDARSRIFEPWHTGRAPGEGTGLGLALVDRISREAGGSVDVSDSGRGGACFTLRLPAVASEDARAA